MIWEGVPSNASVFSGISGSEKAWDVRSVIDPPHGIKVPIEVSRMITDVVVGPRERPWVTELARRVLQRYGLQMPIMPSNRLTPR